MERSHSTRNPRDIRGCEAADRLESRVKKCDPNDSCHEMTPDIRHFESVSLEASNHAFRPSGAVQLMASKLDFHFDRT
jgi:hypothetical protein